MQTSTTDTYERDFAELSKRLAVYLPDNSEETESYFAAVDAQNDAMNNIWFDGIDLDTWEQTVIKRLGYDHA